MKKMATNASISVSKSTHIEKETQRKSRVETTKNDDFSAVRGQNVGFGLYYLNFAYTDK